MSAQDYIKFLIGKLTIKTTKEVQKQEDINQDVTLYSSRWLGVLPFAFKAFFKKM